MQLPTLKKMSNLSCLLLFVVIDQVKTLIQIFIINFNLKFWIILTKQKLIFILKNHLFKILFFEKKTPKINESNFYFETSD